jgi:hypothetical protein
VRSWASSLPPRGKVSSQAGRGAKSHQGSRLPFLC